jgi:hypothetical protein
MCMKVLLSISLTHQGRWSAGSCPRARAHHSRPFNLNRFAKSARKLLMSSNRVRLDRCRRRERNSRDLMVRRWKCQASIRCENTDDECNGLLTGRVRGRSKFLFICDLRLGADAHSRKEPECRHYGKNSAQDQKEIAEH